MAKSVILGLGSSKMANNRRSKSKFLGPRENAGNFVLSVSNACVSVYFVENTLKIAIFGQKVKNTAKMAV